MLNVLPIIWQRQIALAACLAALILPAHKVFAQQRDVLSECMALSTQDDDIHVCLDNFLDAMDDSLMDVTDYIRDEFSGESLAAFERSQAAFETFRRENCLWYVEFSSPRSAAEQIGKNCLARSSSERFEELQQLLTRGQTPAPVLAGFYVYGATRNSFQPCGSESRYLVVGDANMVGDLQLRYSALASVDLQILFASVTGVIDESVDGGADHAGVVNVDSVVDVRMPSESDCTRPFASTASSESVQMRSAADTSLATRVAEAARREGLEVDDASAEDSLQAVQRVNPVADPSSSIIVAEQAGAATTGIVDTQVGGDRLTAYFGAWLADCSVFDGVRQCLLVVDMDGSDLTPKLLVYQVQDGPTTVELRLPDRELASADQILWGIDGYLLGGVTGSELVVTDQLTLQRISDRRFVNEELLPLMRKGTDLRVEIGSAADGGAGQYRATLLGLTRALNFASDFLEGGS